MPKKNTASVIKQARSLSQKGEHRQLIAWVNKHVQSVDPNNQSKLFLFLAHSYYRLHDYPQGVLAAQACVDKLSTNAEGWYYLGLCYWKLKNIEKSLSCYQQAIELNPEKSSYLLNAAMVLRELNRHQEAIPLYEALLDIDPQSRIYLRNKISATRYTSTDCDDYKIMHKVLQNPLSHADDKMHACFGLVKIYMDCGMYEQAQACAIEGNQLRGKIFPFSQNTFKDHVDSIISNFQDVDWTQSGHVGSRALFIMGLSRSGKSLLESLIAQSPQIYAKHECCFMGSMMEDACHALKASSFYPKVFQKLKEDNFHKFSQDFYRLLCYGVDNHYAYVTDTTPQNTEHMGLLKLMFPNAKFIYCKRDLSDHHLKIFLKYYFKGNGYANDMQDIAFYDEQIQKLMKFWKESCGIDYLTVEYDELVQHPEKVLNEVTSFLGVEPWAYQINQLNTNEVGLSERFPQLCEVKGKSSKRLGL